MSYKKTLLEIVEEVQKYLDKCYPYMNGNFTFVMDAGEEGINWPDYEEVFVTPIGAIGYLLETGLPVWVVGDSGYPYEALTLNKLEVLFDI